MSQYAIVIEADGSTNYSAYAPDLPGVVATGDTLEEAEAAMREAIEFHIEGRCRLSTWRILVSSPSLTGPPWPLRNLGCVHGAGE